MSKACLSISLIVFLSVLGCSSEEKEQMKAENDSLRNELNTRYSLVVMMRDVKVMIDSIDDSRRVLHADLSEGTTYEDVTSRLQNINQYVQQTERKLETMETDLKNSKSEASAYMMMVAALKDELSIRAEEVYSLEQQVVTFRKENTGLVKTVKLQQAELSDVHRKIEIKQEELSLLEAKVTEMVDNFKVSEAEAYFARAQATEEAAIRTKLAPQKKKQTYREALELYKKSLELGKKEAEAKITELEKRVK